MVSCIVRDMPCKALNVHRFAKKCGGGGPITNVQFKMIFFRLPATVQNDCFILLRNTKNAGNTKNKWRVGAEK